MQTTKRKHTHTTPVGLLRALQHATNEHKASLPDYMDLRGRYRTIKRDIARLHTTITLLDALQDGKVVLVQRRDNNHSFEDDCGNLFDISSVKAETTIVPACIPIPFGVELGGYKFTEVTQVYPYSEVMLWENEEAVKTMLVLIQECGIQLSGAPDCCVATFIGNVEFLKNPVAEIADIDDKFIDYHIDVRDGTDTTAIVPLYFWVISVK